MEVVYWLWWILGGTATNRRKRKCNQTDFNRVVHEKEMGLVSEFIMTETKGQDLHPPIAIKSKSLQYTAKIMGFILIPAELTMSGWNFEYLPFKFLLNVRKMWGRRSFHSYAGEHEARVLLCKLVKNNGCLGTLNQIVLHVAQACPILQHIYAFFSPYFSICWIHQNLSKALCRRSAWTSASLPVNAFRHSFRQIL